MILEVECSLLLLLNPKGYLRLVHLTGYTKSQVEASSPFYKKGYC